MTRWLAVLLVGLSAGPAVADSADDLLTLIPPDTAICVVVRDLRGTTGRLNASPFARWLDESKLLDPFLPPAERQKLRDAERFLTDKLGSTSQQLLDDVFGDVVVLSYRPGPPDRPQDETGVLLLHARDPARLATSLDRLNALQTESGELKAVTERGRYLVRTRADGGTEYVHRDGPFLAFSAQESVLKEVLTARRPAVTPKGSPAGESIRRMGLADAAAVVWFHPQVLAADLHAKRDAASTPAAEKAALAQVAKVWAACDGLAVSTRVGERLEVGVTAAIDPARLPASVRAVLYPTAGGSAWGAVPPNALLAVGGRFDLPALVAAADSFLPAGEAASTGLADALGPLVGKSNVSAVLGGIGPEWVAWAEAPELGWVPEWTVAVKLSPVASKPVLQALDLGASLLRLAHNRDHPDPLDVAESTVNGRTVKYLVGGLPQRPSYGLADGFLVLASSPDRVHRFKAAAGDGNPPLVRLDAARLRQFLADRRDELAKGLAAQNGRPAADLLRDLDGLANVLRAVNRLELRHTASDGLIRLTLNVELVKPLK